MLSAPPTCQAAIESGFFGPGRDPCPGLCPSPGLAPPPGRHRDFVVAAVNECCSGGCSNRLPFGDCLETSCNSFWRGSGFCRVYRRGDASETRLCRDYGLACPETDSYPAGRAWQEIDFGLAAWIDSCESGHVWFASGSGRRGHPSVETGSYPASTWTGFRPARAYCERGCGPSLVSKIAGHGGDGRQTFRLFPEL